MALMHRRIAIIEAPSVLGLKPTGVEGLGKALLHNGLAERVHAQSSRLVEAPHYGGERDSETLTLNAHAIATWSPTLADAVEDVLNVDEFPLILGGDCSILLGSMLALRRRGQFGLLFIDGHADFYQPEVNPNGEAASMELAFVTGFGPELLTNLEQREPLVRAKDTVAFGFRDIDEQRQYGSQPLSADLLALDLPTIRGLGVDKAVASALERVARPDLDGFFIHVDADVLDDAIMPAVDYRLADGLTWEELRLVLKAALSTGRAAGLEITIYNPALDEDGLAGRELTSTLASVLGTSVAWTVSD